MVMCLALFHMGDSLTLVTAYENGLATVFRQDDQGSWDLLYRAQSHSQPVLSLDVAPSREYFLTSSADALVVKHPIPQQNASASSHPATATATPQVTSEAAGAGSLTPGPVKGKSLLSAALAAAGPQPGIQQPRPKAAVEVQTQPLKVLNTKHSGQQSLRVRSDGRIFATAGWDAKVRVYSARTMRELAVLKWHAVGCYAVAFAELPAASEGGDGEDPTSARAGAPSDAGTSTETSTEGGDNQGQNMDVPAGTGSADLVPATRIGELTVKERRIKHAKEAHWLAVGSKDGKISLWDIY